MTDVAGGLITLEYALEGLGYGAPQFVEGKPSARDADIITYIKAATPIIEKLAGAVLQRTTTQRRDGGKSAVLVAGQIVDEAAVSAVRVDGEAWAEHVVDAETGIIYAGGGRVFPAGTRNVEIELTVGPGSVPHNLQLATRELVRHWVQNGKQSPAAGVLNVTGGADASPTDDWAIPRRVRQLCAPHAESGLA